MAIQFRPDSPEPDISVVETDRPRQYKTRSDIVYIIQTWIFVHKNASVIFILGVYVESAYPQLSNSPRSRHCVIFVTSSCLYLFSHELYDGTSVSKY